MRGSLKASSLGPLTLAQHKSFPALSSQKVPPISELCFGHKACAQQKNQGVGGPMTAKGSVHLLMMLQEQTLTCFLKICSNCTWSPEGTEPLRCGWLLRPKLASCRG